MCLTPRFRAAQGRSEPASVHLSPVTRDYPSRAFSGVFQAVALRLFYQGTGQSVGGAGRKMKRLFLTFGSPGGGGE